ncbi:MAG: hypothetical protein WCO28_10355 [Bacteroidota bacterium]|jgi:hypothetical protein
MKTLKMSLENIQGKLCRNEMKNIIAGQNQASAGNEITCYRPGESITASPEVCGAWASVWTAFGYPVNCSNGFNNGIYFV